MKCSKCNSWLGRKFLFTIVAFVLSGVMAFAQTKTVTGTIVDEFGEPIIGANVLVKGTTNGAVTDIDGNYSITGVSNADELVVSYIGYASQTFPVGNQSTFNITMKEDGENLEEVVVVGYGVQKKKDLTGSVSSIKSADIQNVAASNAMQAMQAKVPGMDLQQSSGQAGAGVSISLRGSRSIEADNSPLILVDGVEYSGDLDIPAGDIESMDILKDASSTAIYGTKGANGVIIITTKRGKAGKTNVNVNSYWSFNSPTSAVKSMYGNKEVQRWIDRDNYVADHTSGNWGSANTTINDIFGAQTLDDNVTKIVDIINNGSFTDWYDEIFQSSTTQNYEVSVNGGSEKTNFSLSLSAMLDRGLLKNDAMNRYNGRINLDHRINKVLKVGGSFAFTFKNHDARNGSVFNSARKMTSITHAYNADGTINETPNIWYVAHVNPLMDEGDNYQKNVETTRFVGSAYVQADIMKGMIFKSQFAIDRTNARTGVYQDFKSVGRYQSPSTTAISNGNSTATRLTWQNTFNYIKTLADNHDITVLLGHEMSQYLSEGLSLAGTAGKEHYYNASFYDASKILQNGDLSYSSNYTKSTLLSFFGRLNYSFASRYLLQASVRADGSSVLADGHKWGAFPSVSAGWRIIDEEWMQGFNEAARMDNLKLRASWGLSGNAAVDPYQTLATVFATTPSSATDFIPTSMSNEDLSWETTSAWNFGIDYGFLGGRINGTVDYYLTKTSDLLYYKSAPPSSVFTSVLSNIGESKGYGIEVALNALAVRTSDFSWDINATYTHSHDEVVKLADGLERNISGTTGYIVGEPISIYYDYASGDCWNVGEFEQYLSQNNLTADKYPSYYGTPGTMKIIDQDLDGDLDEDDKIVYNRAPKHILGLTNTFTYKGIGLSVQMMARLGGYMAYDKNNALGLDDGDANWADLDYWTPNNSSKIPSPGTNDNNLKNIYTSYKTALLYEKADYFKIKDITLSYNFDKKLLNKAHIANAKVYCSMKNFFTFNRLDDDYDPERGGSISFPLAKQVVLGVNLSF